MRAVREGAAVLMLAAASVGLVGCVPPSDSAAQPVASTPASQSPTMAASDAPEDADRGGDPVAEADALSVATKAVAAYCRPDLDKGAWLAGLTPLLTDAGVIAYDTVDPSKVPCHSVTGAASTRDGDDTYVFRINVPTDAGQYEAYVTRSTTDAPWRVERMAPPE